MKIYGVAILAACFLIGQWIGEVLGVGLGIGGNVGGVGFGMLFLVLLNDRVRGKTKDITETKEGAFFWSAMYIPIVVAMAATLNVKAAATGGWAAVLVGVVATGFCFLLIPLISKVGRNGKSSLSDKSADPGAV